MKIEELFEKELDDKYGIFKDKKCSKCSAII